MNGAKSYLLFVQKRIEVLQRLIGEDIDKAFEDEIKELAIERVLETIADATKHFPEMLKAAHPEIPWGRIVGFRNWMVHGYFGINPDIMRGVIEEDIQPLKHAIEEYLKTHG